MSRYSFLNRLPGNAAGGRGLVEQRPMTVLQVQKNLPIKYNYDFISTFLYQFMRKYIKTSDILSLKTNMKV